MSEGQYPVFDIPGGGPGNAVVGIGNGRAPAFDFETGDFVRDGANRIVMTDGYAAYRAWVLKMLLTACGACIAYPTLGLSHESAAAERKHSAVKATYERVITECLLRHPMTERVRDFAFALEGDRLDVRFTVQRRGGEVFEVAGEDGRWALGTWNTERL